MQDDELDRAKSEIQLLRRQLEEAEKRAARVQRNMDRLLGRRSVRAVLALTRPISPLIRRWRSLRDKTPETRSADTASQVAAVHESFSTRLAFTTRIWLQLRRLASPSHFDKTTVSIVMPTYNRAAVLPDAIESVMRQSHQQWELLIVDDGSTDETEAVVHRYTSDSRVRYFKTENQGVSSARNYGLFRATGAVVAYLDSDNAWNRDYLRLMVVKMLSDSLDCAYSAVEVLDEAGRTRFYRGAGFDWEECRWANYIDINALVHRRSLVDDGFEPKLRRMVDWDFILRITRGAKVAYVPFLGCKYVASHEDPLRITRHEPEVWAEVVRARHATDGTVLTWDEVAKRLKLSFAIKIAAPKEKRDEWGDFHFANSLAKALESLGHEVRIDFKEDWQSSGRTDVNLVLRGLKEFTPKRGAINVLWNISHPDKVRRSELLGCQIVYAASQSHARLIGLELGRDEPLVRALMQCTDEQLFNPDRGRDESHYSDDVLFVGNARADFRPMVRWALEADLDFRVYGEGWSDIIEDARIRNTLIDNRELGAAYANSRFVLNDHWPSMSDFGIISNRVFDVAATGTRLISDPHPALETVFGSTIRQVDSAAELKSATEEEGPPAEDLSELANWVIANHTFSQRARFIADDVLSYLNLPRIHNTPPAVDTVASFKEPPSSHRIKVGITIPRGEADVERAMSVRLIGPLSTEYACERLEVIEVAPGGLPDDLDVLILQRPTVPADDARALARWARDQKVNLIVDISTAPPSESLKLGADETTAAHRDILDIATSAWFSTKELQNRHSESFEGKTGVFADSIDPRVWRPYRRSSDQHASGEGSRRLLLMGSGANRREFGLIYPALRELANQFSFELFVLNGVLGDVPDEPWLSFLEPTRSASYSEFGRWLMKEGPFDIGLAPLSNTPSNRAESDIDFLNYSALGLLSVVSDRPPYSHSVGAKGLAVLCPDDAWVRSLAEVFESPWRFRSIRERAQQYVWSERTMETTSRLLVSEIERVAAR